MTINIELVKSINYLITNDNFILYIHIILNDDSIINCICEISTFNDYENMELDKLYV